MVPSLIIASLSCLILIAVVIVCPSVTIKGKSISIYPIPPLVGAVLLLLLGKLPMGEFVDGLFSSDAINPVKILVLFISMTMLSIFLDEIGFFKYMAAFILSKAGGSQKRLFVCLYLLVSVLTVFTSNDIIILTFTPFICHFAKHAKIDPMPYLFAEFVAANTWSMMLIIGNPTNVYLASSSGISFMHYISVMALPTLGAGLMSLLALFLLFQKKLSTDIQSVSLSESINDKGGLIIGLIHLGLCTIMLVISSYIPLEMWSISLIFAGSLFLTVAIYRLVQKKKPFALLMCLKRAPWELIPFVLSMFVFVLTMRHYHVTGEIATLFGDKHPLLKYGLGSFVSANVINNIPMSVFFSSIIENVHAGIKDVAIYATVIGSNLGAFFTPIGALAGIMWSNILKRHEVKFSFFAFIKYGVIISIPALLAALCVLHFVL